MAGNFTAPDGTVNIKLAAMHLNWNIPQEDKFIPWLQEVKAAGYEGITSFAHWGLENFIERPQDLKVLLDDHGLEMAAVDVRLHDDFQAYIPILKFMASLDCKLMVCIDPAGTKKEYQRFGKILNTIGEMALEYGVHAHYHNHTDSLGETYFDMESLIAELDPDKVSLMLDIGHATKDFVEFPPEERAIRFLEKYWQQIHYLEFKDWNEASDLNTPLGEGYADYDRIFALIKEKGYSGWITIEQNGNDGLSLKRSPLECARISREFVREKLGV